MAKKKKAARKSKTQSSDYSDIDAWIDAESRVGGGCPICSNAKAKAELDRLEKRLRSRRKRVPIRAVWRWLTSKKLVDGIKQDRMSKILQRPCHLKFYQYLRELE